MTDILIWKHKHGSNFYDASTEEALQSSALDVLRTLMEWDYIYKPEEPNAADQWSGWDESLTEMDDEDVKNLPPSLKKAVLKERQKRDSKISNYEVEIAEYRQIEAMLDGKKLYYPVRDRETKETFYRRLTPWALLQQRAGGEYEDFDIERIDSELHEDWVGYTGGRVSEVPADGVIANQI